MNVSRWGVRVVVLALLFAATNAHACAVCFGDPDSPMTKGVAAGVFVLLGFISAVLVGIAGVAFFWAYRGRRLSGSAS